ncbi:MAG TPA: DUF2807 domain-containing protein [Bacteroidales bacterium]|jgi:hypothetical protein|nr:DUF2807 domain-containing protein [Bacteroidales bacterium]
MKIKIAFLAVTTLLFAFSIKAQVQKEITVSSFNEVKFEGSAQWILIPAHEEKVVIESKSKDIFEKIKVVQSGDLLTISTTEKDKSITKLFKSVIINVYFKSIESVSLSGVGSVKANEIFKAEKFAATLRGTGSMDLNIKCSDFAGNMFGTGVLTTVGYADKAVVRVEGVGTFEGYGFVTTDMDITVSGVGAAKVYTTGNLMATLNGVGSIKYMDDPKTKNLDTNGLGSIKQKND